jgi:FdhE protein
MLHESSMDTPGMSSVSGRVILPDPPRIFLDRSRRLTSLSEGHSLAEWLLFLARVTAAQHNLLRDSLHSLSLNEETFVRNRSREFPLFPAVSHSRDFALKEAVVRLADEVIPFAPSPARLTLERLRSMDEAELGRLADRVLQIQFDGVDKDSLPFVAAVLQAHWTTMASKLMLPDIKPSSIFVTCPFCGYLPGAAIVRTGGDVSGLRYLHCALCNTEWHLVRVTCTGCTESDRVSYLHVDSGDPAVRAEVCDGCGGYLKIMYQEKSPAVDPIADDLATLALDLLVDAAGYNRLGPNLLLIPGGDARS